jgi:hypothetical protein
MSLPSMRQIRKNIQRFLEKFLTIEFWPGTDYNTKITRQGTVSRFLQAIPDAF